MSTAGTPLRESDDWAGEMLAIATRQDRDGFLRIYDHFMPRLCLYLRGTGLPDAIAEELAQDAMLKLWQNACGYDPARSAVSTWLFRIARNLMIDRQRRERVRPQPAGEAIAIEPVSEATSAEDHTDYLQLQRRIDALSPVQARLIRMSYFEAKSHQDIATELALPLGTVKSHLRRAFLRLQGDMAGDA